MTYQEYLQGVRNYAPGQESDNTNAMTILYIDDDAEDIEIFQDAVKTVDPSIRYIGITRAEDAIELLGKTDTLPDHIFLDINMPGMNGTACLKELRKEKRFDPVNIVIYSTSGFPTDIAQIESMRATFMQKATSFKELCRMIETLAGK